MSRSGASVARGRPEVADPAEHRDYSDSQEEYPRGLSG